MDVIWEQVFHRPAGADLDVDEDLYNGFVGKEDRRLLESLRKETPAKLATARHRSRIRAWPNCCSATAPAISRRPCPKARWSTGKQHRAARFYDGAGGARTIDQFSARSMHLRNGCRRTRRADPGRTVRVRGADRAGALGADRLIHPTLGY
jgi:exodeoxyribonuclease-1